MKELRSPEGMLRIRHDVAMCAFCPKMCHPVCPVGRAEGRETTTTWGKMSHAYRMLEHGAPHDSARASVFAACTGCGACRELCAHGVDASSVLIALRQDSRRQGCAPHAVALAARHRQFGHLGPEDLFARYAGEVRSEAATAQDVLISGITALVERPGLAGLTQRLLGETGEPVARVAPGGLDPGRELLWAGLAETFSRHAHEVSAALARVRTVICMDPEDAYLLRRVYPAWGIRLRPRVMTVVEVLDDRIDRLPTRGGPLWTYHDPCYLGRRLGVFEPPRRVLTRALGRPPLEFAWRRELSRCVGGGGLYPRTNPAGALAAAAGRVSDLSRESCGIVTACPGAESLLNRAGIEVVDVVEVVSAERAGFEHHDEREEF